MLQDVVDVEVFAFFECRKGSRRGGVCVFFNAARGCRRGGVCVFLMLQGEYKRTALNLVRFHIV